MSLWLEVGVYEIRLTLRPRTRYQYFPSRPLAEERKTLSQVICANIPVDAGQFLISFYLCYMETLRRGQWADYRWLMFPYGLYLPVVIGGLWWSISQTQLWQVACFTGGGLFFWTFVEYLLHRWGFHEPPGGPLAKKHNIHWGHHTRPHAPDRIVTHPLQSLPLAVLFLGIFWLIGQGHPLVWAFYGGFGIGYLAYETLHFLIHVHPQPPMHFLRRLWQHHHWHHFRDDSRYFGVTNRFWDWIFRTA